MTQDENGPVVGTGSGRVRGRIEHGLAVFRGIPYAAPPEGPLRFRAPAPPQPWDGTRDASRFGTAPPQAAVAPGIPPFWRPGDGLDCLHLNVWTPDPGASGLPVLVYLYGGAWKHGTAGVPQHDGSRLAAAGVVVVTLNYRVGFEGFGHLPGRPDNRGLLDQLAALHWVRRNIAGFGGDPDRVTLFGQSAGGAATALLAATPAARGLLRRVIVQSLPNGFHERAEAARVTRIIAGAAGVPATAEGFETLAPQALLAVQDAPLVGPESGVSAFAPVIDDDLVLGRPWEIPPDPAVDLLCGFTHQEFRLFAQGMDLAAFELEYVAEHAGPGKQAADAYRAAFPGRPDSELMVTLMSDAVFRLPSTWTAEAHARAGGRTWLYDFARPGRLGACHSVDVPYVFGHCDNRFAVGLLGPQPVGFEELSGQVRAAWTGFAATGDPGWPRFGPDRVTRVWDAPPYDTGYPLEASYRIWSPDGPGPARGR